MKRLEVLIKAVSFNMCKLRVQLFDMYLSPVTVTIKWFLSGVLGSQSSLPVGGGSRELVWVLVAAWYTSSMVDWQQQGGRVCLAW